MANGGETPGSGDDTPRDERTPEERLEATAIEIEGMWAQVNIASLPAGAHEVAMQIEATVHGTDGAGGIREVLADPELSSQDIAFLMTRIRRVVTIAQEARAHDPFYQLRQKAGWLLDIILRRDQRV